MKIDVDEQSYRNSSDDDKIRLFLLIQDVSFQKQVETERKKLGITKSSIKRIYELSEPKTIELSRKLQESALKLIKDRFYLDERWLGVVFTYILQNKLLFLPSNYYVSENEKGIQINITKLVSRDDLHKWIDNNWRQLEGMSRTSTFFKRKSDKKYKLPKRPLLRDVVTIYSLKSQGYSYGKIADEMDKDRKYIENIYLRINKTIKQFDDEANKQKILLSKLQIK